MNTQPSGRTAKRFTRGEGQVCEQVQGTALRVIQLPRKIAEHHVREAVVRAEVADQVIHLCRRQQEDPVDIIYYLLEDHEAGPLPGQGAGGVMMDYPSLVISPHHRHMGKDLSVFLVREMAGYLGVLLVELAVGFLEIILV